MGVTINASNNYISDQGSIIQQYNEYTTSDAVREPRDINMRLDCLEEIRQAVTALEQALSAKDHSKVTKALADYAKAFTSATFSQLASDGLKRLLF